jgi:hypothetical protein
MKNTLARWSAGCSAEGVIVHGDFLRQGENRYLQQIYFFTHWFRDLVPFFSICELLENSPMSQQALISGRMLTGTFLLI